MSALDPTLSALLAQLIAAFEAEGYPALPYDLKPATRELVQWFSALNALKPFVGQPPRTPEEHATYYAANLTLTALAPRSTKSNTETRHFVLCEEVLQIALARDMTVDKAIETVSERHGGKRGTSAATIRLAYLTHHKNSPYSVLLEAKRKLPPEEEQGSEEL